MPSSGNEAVFFILGAFILAAAMTSSGLSARLAHRAGFDVLFMGGFSVAATLLGEPDFGYLTQTEIADTARRVCRLTDRPVLVDADTGYGNALNVIRTVELFQNAGADGMFLEDQVWPKRCGHMGGKRVVERGEWLAKLRAVLETRGGRDCFLGGTHRCAGGDRTRRSHRTRPGGPRPRGRIFWERVLTLWPLWM